MKRKRKKPASKKWIPVDEFLPKKFKFDYNKDVQKVINYIVKERESLIYEGKNPKSSYIFLNPASKVVSSVNNFNAAKFLVFLKRKGVIASLYLPISVRETNNKEIIKVKSSIPVWFSPEGAVLESLKDPKGFKKKACRLKVKKWERFLEIKNKLEKQTGGLVKEKKEETLEEIGEGWSRRKTAMPKTFEIQVKDRENY